MDDDGEPGLQGMSIHTSIGGVMLLATMSVACSGTAPSLPLTEANAPAVAAAAFVANGWLSATAQSPRGELITLPLAPFAEAKAGVQPCGERGMITTVISEPLTTVEFDDCEPNRMFRLDGTIKASMTWSGSVGTPYQQWYTVILDVTAIVMIESQKVARSMSGDYDAFLEMTSNPDPALSTLDLQLKGSRLSIGVSGGGGAEESIVISDFDSKHGFSGMPLQLTTEVAYDLTSSRLDGGVTVTTVDALSDRPDHPRAGRLLVIGAQRTRLQITILGDDTAPGQTPIELRLDTGRGSFGSPHLVSWAMLESLMR